MPQVGPLSRNPSYPQRIHAYEKPHWDRVLADAQAQLDSAERKLETLRNDSRFPEYRKIVCQLAGARDQIAEMARRLPNEVGHGYEEDRHRLDQAVAALNRLAAKLPA